MGMRHRVTKACCSIQLNWSQEPMGSKRGHRQICQDPSYHANLLEQCALSLTSRPSEQLSTKLPVGPEDQLYIGNGAHLADLTISLQHREAPVSLLS